MKNKEKVLEILEKKLLNDTLTLIVAKQILERLDQVNFSARKSEETLASSISFLAYKKSKTPRTIEEVVTIFETKRNEAFKLYVKIKKALGMKYCETASISGETCILLPKVEDYVKRGMELFNFNDEEQKRLIEETKRLFKEIDFSTMMSSPQSLASGILYIGCVMVSIKKNYREVANVMGITEVTLRISKNKLLQFLKKEDLKEFILKSIGRKMEDSK